MRILYVLNATALRGGATKSFLALADTLTSEGNEIAVMVPDEDGVTRILRERGWKVLCVPYGYSALPRLSSGIRDAVRFIPRLIRNLALNVKAKREAISFAEEWKPDLVHDNTSVTDIGHSVAVGLGIPHVIHIREYGWEDFRLVILGLRKRLAWKKAYGVAITSRLAAFRGGNLPEGRMTTVYNGIVKDVSSSYVAVKQPYLLYAGRILPSKGVGDLAEAYAAYATAELGEGRRPLRLRLAGEAGADGFADSLRNRFSAVGLEEYVDWLGSVDDMTGCYAEAAATVIPSFNEGFGRVFPEAVAAGSLCVVRNSAGLAEQLENGRKVTGGEIALSFNDVPELTAILGEIGRAYSKGGAFEDGGSFKEMIEAGRKTVGRLYTYGAYASGIKDVYRRAVEDTEKQK